MWLTSAFMELLFVIIMVKNHCMNLRLVIELNYCHTNGKITSAVRIVK